MANNEDKDLGLKDLDGIKQVVDAYKSHMEKATYDLSAYEKKLKKETTKIEEDRRKNLEEELYKLRVNGVLKSQEEEYKYAQKALAEQQNNKLRSELSILKSISSENEKERKKEQKYLELEKSIVILKNRGDKESLERAKKQEKELKKEQQKDQREKDKKEARETYNFGDEIKKQFNDLTDDLNLGFSKSLSKGLEKNLGNALKSIGKALTDTLSAVNNSISDYARYQTAINTRLQGISSFSNAVDALSKVAYSPLLKTSELYSNLSSLVSSGIVSNVEQKAFLQTIKSGIADTFDVTDASLRRLIRIQQADSTAARLGMEGYLTRFLNTYVQNTEYLQSTFDTVADSLLEASAAIKLASENSGSGASTEFEYIVQKWLGALTGVGLSDSLASSIGEALGKLGSGDTDVLSSDVGQLLTISASRTGLNIGDLLQNGLNAKNTNDLMLAMTEYLQEIANSGSNVVISSLSKIFGATVSDVAAVTNLTSERLDEIYKDMLTYQGMYTELQNQFGQLAERQGIANILENLFSNYTYQTGMTIAANPATYATWKITDLIQGVTGGINIPFVTALGSGVDLETTVENLMKLGIIGVSTFSAIGDIQDGLSTVLGDKVKSGKTLLENIGIKYDENEKSQYGKGLGQRKRYQLRQSSTSTSELAYIGQHDSDAYYKSTLNSAKDEAQKELEVQMNKYQDPVADYLINDVNLKYKLDSLLNIQETNQNAAKDLLNNIVGDLKNNSGTSDETVKNQNAVILTVSNLLINQISDSSNALSNNILLINDNLTNNFDTLLKILSSNSAKDYNNTVSSIINPNTGTINSSNTETIINNATSDISKSSSTTTISPNGDVNITNNYYITANGSLEELFNKTGIDLDRVGGTSVSSNADIGAYLDNIEFSVGFKSLVENVDKIANRFINSTTSASSESGYNNSSNSSNDSLSGFTQFTF